MRFVEDGIRILIKELDPKTSSGASATVKKTHEFKSFITNINEGFKYTFKPSTSRLYPLVRYNNIESYYMELSLDFDSNKLAS